ncbi:ribosomal protein L11 methyltransferase isoform X2 [Phoenix dactylifera]|uniref:ETFB lysine methyltransferase n=1 Tax=Phoenix dactylifera TaxID=42345 RepID=A0A8B9AQE9_PHODC|nr:ribosomal protein L11 methyltransferase isoform X2 [Phoenix dactylifera]
MLLCRLRLLKRSLSLQIPRPAMPLAMTTSFTSVKNLSSLFPPPPPRSFSKGSRLSPLHRHPKRRREERFFCARTMETDDPTSSDASLFSPYLSARIRCNKRDADTLSEALLCFGASSASIDELSNCEDFDEIWITSIFPVGQDVDACVSGAAGSIGLNYEPNYEISAGEQRDWVTNVQEVFHPTEITDGLWIVPRWRNPLDLQATNIILDPGLAFGTGEHPTTKLCLLLLRRLIKGGEHFLDYGTGSGVLGIAAVKMGATLSVGIDIDPQAVASARQNIALNNIDSKRMLVYLVRSKASSLYSNSRTQENPEEKALYDHELGAAKEKFDIVIANILLNPLMELAEDIVAYGKPDAIIGLSGVLSEQVQQIKEIYSLYLDNISVSEMEGWTCLYGTKRKM